jgi:hypothetical protein
MYANQIRILEAKLKQLQNNGSYKEQDIMEQFMIQSEIKRLRRLEWQEIYETVKMENDRD